MLYYYMLKRTIFLILLSLSISSDRIDYSVGLNEHLGFFGPISKSWITEQGSTETHKIIGGLGVIGGIGYGRKYYFLGGDGFFNPYISVTGLGYYVLVMAAGASLGVSASIGTDIAIVEWNQKRITLQFGIIGMYDLIRGESPLIGADNGPPGVMPSINLKIGFIK